MDECKTLGPGDADAAQADADAQDTELSIPGRTCPHLPHLSGVH